MAPLSLSSALAGKLFTLILLLNRIDTIDTVTLDLQTYSYICNDVSTSLSSVGDSNILSNESQTETVCETCSCAIDCVKTRSCCMRLPAFYQERTVSDIGTCRPPTKGNDQAYHTVHLNQYFMVDQCDNQNMTSDDNAKQTTWKSMLPVYSPAKGITYINSEISNCNSVNDGMVWMIAVRCFLRLDLGRILNIVNKLLLDNVDNDVCILYYLPPNNSSIRNCQMDSGLSCMYLLKTVGSIADDHIEMCSNSKENTQLYSNGTFYYSFCFECFDGQLGQTIINQECNSNIRIIADSYLTPDNFMDITLEPDAYNHIEEHKLKQQTDHLVCVTLPQLAQFCRPILCAERQYFYKGECHEIYLEWSGGFFSIFVKFTPSTPNKISMRQLNAITLEINEIYVSSESKISVSSVMYHPIENNSYIDYLLINAYIKSKQIKTYDLFYFIKQLTETPQQIFVENSSFTFDVSFHKYRQYLTIFQIPSDNPLRQTTCFRATAGISFSFQFPNKRNDGLDIVCSISIQIVINAVFPLTRQYICKQAEFKDYEYVDYEQFVYIRTLNIYLMDGQYIHANSKIRTCLDWISKYTIKKLPTKVTSQAKQNSLTLSLFIVTLTLICD